MTPGRADLTNQLALTFSPRFDIGGQRLAVTRVTPHAQLVLGQDFFHVLVIAKDYGGAKIWVASSAI
jgi:hypothetical protein